MIVGQGSKKVAVIGLGLMGSALADTLIAAGFDVTIWNRTTSKAERLKSAGAHLASTVADAARDCDLLVVCLSNHAATKGAVMSAEVGQALQGKTMIEMTFTGDSELTELEQWAEVHCISLLRGAPLVYPDDVRAGHGTVVYGGRKQSFDANVQALKAMGGNPVFVGENTEDPNRVVEAYTCVLLPVLIGFLQGAAVCHAHGLSIKTFADETIQPLLQGPILKGMISGLARATAARCYDEKVQGTLTMWSEGIAGILGGIRNAGVDPAHFVTMQALFERAEAQGYGNQDLASIFEILIEQNR